MITVGLHKDIMADAQLITQQTEKSVNFALLTKGIEKYGFKVRQAMMSYLVKILRKSG